MTVKSTLGSDIWSRQTDARRVSTKAPEKVRQAHSANLFQALIWCKGRKLPRWKVNRARLGRGIRAPAPVSPPPPAMFFLSAIWEPGTGCTKAEGYTAPRWPPWRRGAGLLWRCWSALASLPRRSCSLIRSHPPPSYPSPWWRGSSPRLACLFGEGRVDTWRSSRMTDRTGGTWQTRMIIRLIPWQQERWALSRHRGNMYLTSLPLVSVRSHGHVTRWTSRINFLSSASSVSFGLNFCRERSYR